MAQTIKLKRSNTAGNLPTTSDLALGEVAINTKDGKFFLRKHVDGTDSGDAITAYAPQGLNVYGTQTFEVKVITKTASHPQYGTGSANGYSIDGLESPFIVLVPGNTYKFDQSDSSNTGHPLAFYLEEDKTTSYTTSVTTNGTPGSSGAYTQIVVSTSTPQVLYYQCSSHAYMGSGSYTLSDAIADGKVGTAQLAANAVTSAKIAANSVDSSELVTGSIDTIHIGDLQVTSAKIANNTIATGNIADNAVDATKIASNSILTRHIDDNQVGIDQLNVTDGTSGQALTTDGAGTLSFSTVASSLSGASDTDITTPSSGQILVHDGTDSFDNVSISGDATLSSAGVLTIATNAIESTMIAQNSILTKHIDDNQIGIDQLNVTDGTSGQVLTTDGAGSLSFSTVSGGGGSQNVFTTIAVSGQSNVVADSTTDTLTLAAGTGITLTTNASTDTITITGTTGLSANSVTATEIATGAVGPSELAATTVTAGSYTNTDITVDADGRITSASNGTAVIADGAITTAKLADDAVTADKLANTAVTAGTYGSTTVSPQITVDAQGRITNVSNQTISGGGGSGGIGLNQTVSVYEGTGDGSTTAFNTGTTINAESLTWVFVDGVYQEKGTYSTSGSTVTFSTAPPNGTSIEVNNLSNVTTGGAFNHNSYNGDGSTTDFTLSKAPGSDTDLIVFIDGVYQNADAFNVSSTTLSFDTAPANGTKVIAYTIGGVVMGKTMIVDTFSGNGSTTAFTLSMDPTKEENTQVYVGGVYQPKGTYSLSGTTLTFSEAPPTGTSNIEVNISQVTTLTEVGANSVSATSIAANAVGSAEIAANSVDSSELVTGSIDTIHIGDDQVTNAKLAVNSVSAVELAGNSVTSTQIAANQVGISELNLSDGTNGQYLQTDGAGTLSFSTVSGYTDSDVETYLNTSEIYTDSTNNRVGIGTTSPDQLLQVGSESYGANAIIKTQVDGSDVGNFDSGLHMRSHDDNFGGSIVLESRSGTNDIVNFKYHNNSSAGVTAMAIDATNGNVGIGTSSPDADLSLLSPVYSSGGAGNGIRFQNQNNNADAIIQSYYSGTSSSALFSAANAYVATSSLITSFDNTKASSFLLANTNGSVEFGNAASGNPTTKMLLNSSGNVGIGTISPTDYGATANTLEVKGASGSGSGLIKVTGADGVVSGALYASGSSTMVLNTQTNHALSFNTNNTERMRIASNGDVGIGLTNPAHVLSVYEAGDGKTPVRFNTGNNEPLDFYNDSETWKIQSGQGIGFHAKSTGLITFYTTDSETECARWTNNRAFKTKQGTSAYANATSNYNEICSDTGATANLLIRQGSTYYADCINLWYYSGTPNNTQSNFLNAFDSTATRAKIFSNGGFANYQSNDSNLCDEREKKNIVTANSTWNDVKSWNIKTFHYNEDDDNDAKRYGVIAQDIEKTNPDLIVDWEKQQEKEQELWQEEDKPLPEGVKVGDVKEPAKEQIMRKAVKEQQMYIMAIKALQEAMVEIESLKARIETLEG